MTGKCGDDDGRRCGDGAGRARRASGGAERSRADGLLSALVHAQRTDPAPTDGEIAALARLVLIAGHETAAHVFGPTVLLLLRPPRLWDTLRERPEPVGGVVEEALRHATVLRYGLLRVAREPLTLAGQPVRAGGRVVLHLPAAHHDPARLPDPDRFDPHRPGAANHLAFGHGAHHCPGDHLARVELRTLLAAALPRFPDLRPAVPRTRSAPCATGSSTARPPSPWTSPRDGRPALLHHLRLRLRRHRRRQPPLRAGRARRARRQRPPHLGDRHSRLQPPPDCAAASAWPRPICPSTASSQPPAPTGSPTPT
ncbi:hypothetical protein GCM10009759_72490 [Kitasatospora saccharophila]|uniref:Cytochrome P450 n=1 Tax=Kitasatospora saccharophila TaxID=407973 RepID=A0ABP5JYP9_9ACTN